MSDTPRQMSRAYLRTGVQHGDCNFRPQSPSRPPRPRVRRTTARFVTRLAGWNCIQTQPSATPNRTSRQISLRFLALARCADHSRGHLIATEITSAPQRSTASATDDLPVLRHPLVHFISYRWEWCPAQWLAAADSTLSLCCDLLAEGWILTVATPLNIPFRGTQPVLVDVASIAPRPQSRRCL